MRDNLNFFSLFSVLDSHAKSKEEKGRIKMILEKSLAKKKNQEHRKKIGRHQIISGVIVNTVQDQCVR